MDISSITPPSNATYPSSSSKSTSGSSLDMNDFFKLLAAQLQYQDPLSATSNDQYMAEMAQFSTLQAIQTLLKVENYTMATSIVGKKVSYVSTQSTATGSYSVTTKAGTVDAVDFSGETPKFYVSTTGDDGKVTSSWIDYSAIRMVYSPDVDLNSGSDT
ncbi:hypothetical protein CCDG5_0361 [[Clostridium] cellulosi]|jgi:Flagellar hook capping protein.|uniref:Flagellar hook capping protein n=1 Tax=[Clostridium] cellulosi TaxID=29343 RepID=A0A078KQS8_9FIRM|nr:MAG: hypothetical protein DIU81_00960 [[Clostridium] cellulosi]CDZ23500.1 hypothetical protein CCDG5_0361 [[Clostridium] cellulosi]